MFVFVAAVCARTCGRCHLRFARGARYAKQTPPPWSLTRRRHDNQRTNYKGAAAGAAEARAPTLIVFGGRGFVGSAVCEEALNTGLEVVSISPSGAFGFVLCSV